MTSRTLGIMLVVAVAVLNGCGDEDLPDPSGTFEATEVDLSPRLAGQYVAVGADEGDRVAEGDTLLVTDTELLRLRCAEQEAALAELAARRRAARDEVAQAARSLALAETTLVRLETMLEAGNTTAQRVDEARAQRDIQQRRVAAAGHRLAAIDAEEERLRAGLAVLARQIADGVVLSPLDGTVLLRTAEPGEMGAPGAVALRLADLRRLRLRVYLDEPDLDLVALGRELPVVVDAMPDREHRGRVTWISSEAEFTPDNAQTRDARAQLVYAVELTVDNPDGDLAIGMPAEVVLERAP